MEKHFFGQAQKAAKTKMGSWKPSKIKINRSLDPKVSVLALQGSLKMPKWRHQACQMRSSGTNNGNIRSQMRQKSEVSEQ